MIEIGQNQNCSIAKKLEVIEKNGGHIRNQQQKFNQETLKTFKKLIFMLYSVINSNWIQLFLKVYGIILIKLQLKIMKKLDVMDA